MRLIPGFLVKGVPEITHRITKKGLPNVENLQHWNNILRPIIRERFEMWSNSKEFSLFDSMLELGVMVILHVMVGPAFANEHGEEVIPLLLSYATDDKTVVQALPRWMSETGRRMTRIEQRVG